MTRPVLRWVCHSPSPYNDVLFRALAGSTEFELQVYYLFAESGRHSWGAEADRGYPFQVQRRPIAWELIQAVLQDRRGIFLTACWQDPTTQVILTALMRAARPYLIWNDAPGPGPRTWLKERLRHAFLRAAFARATAVLGTGAPALAAFEAMGARRAALINFPYCVDTEGFTPADRVNAGLIVFGTCARLAHLKGIDLALRAVASLPPDLRARTRYRIAGGEELEASLRGDAERLGIAGQVDFKGWVRQEELPDFYGSLDAYVHPARFEPYGVAVIEALACGLPVLASDATTSALDRMADGKSGFLHRAGDETDLARTMRIFSELPFRRREEMGRAARRSALSWTPREARRTIERLVTSVHSGGCAASSALLEFHQ